MTQKIDFVPSLTNMLVLAFLCFWMLFRNTVVQHGALNGYNLIPKCHIVGLLLTTVLGFNEPNYEYIPCTHNIYHACSTKFLCFMYFTLHGFVILKWLKWFDHCKLSDVL